MFRKNLTAQALPASVRTSPTINLLIVTARPSGAHDVGYRTISRPLVEALRQTSIPIQIEILRPGTYKALENHLSNITAKHGEGYYHVIHFDVHGAVLTYEQFQHIQKESAGNPLKYQRYGRNEIQRMKVSRPSSRLKRTTRNKRTNQILLRLQNWLVCL